MEGDKKSRLGEGHVTLAVSNPRELSQDKKYKRSEVVSVRHTYPLRLLIPEQASCSSCRWIFPMTFGGGLVGGDTICVSFNIGDGCAALVTTQESTKVYRCQEGQISRQRLTYNIHDKAFLAVLGDPVVCFADARFLQTQAVHMRESSSLVLLDWVTAGRMALKELWQFHSYQSVIEVYVEEKLVLRENQVLANTRQLSLQAAMKEYQVLGTCVILGQDDQGLTAHLKQLYGQPCTIGEQPRTDIICSFSPLEAEGRDTTLRGCYVRFLALSTSLAFSVVKEISSKLNPLLGGDPYDKKY